MRVKAECGAAYVAGQPQLHQRSGAGQSIGGQPPNRRQVCTAIAGGGYKIEATQRLGYKFLGDNNLVTAEVLTPRCIARWSPFIMPQWTPPTRRPSGC